MNTLLQFWSEVMEMELTTFVKEAKHKEFNTLELGLWV